MYASDCPQSNSKLRKQPLKQTKILIIKISKIHSAQGSLFFLIIKETNVRPYELFFL